VADFVSSPSLVDRFRVRARFLMMLMSGLLYEASPADPATFMIVGALAIAVAAAPCLLPAIRASRIDPLVSLRKA